MSNRNVRPEVQTRKETVMQHVRRHGILDPKGLLTPGSVLSAILIGGIVVLLAGQSAYTQVGQDMVGTSAVVPLRAASSVFALEIVFLVVATLAAFGYSVVSSPHFLRLYAMIAFTAIAMGMRNPAVRKLAVPDLTTTVLTLTITGLAADSSLARGTNPRLQRRIAAVVAMFAGAALGSITLRHSVFIALALSVVLSSLCGLAWLISSRLPCARTQKRNRSSLIDVSRESTKFTESS
jgi:hypothetical protein